MPKVCYLALNQRYCNDRQMRDPEPKAKADAQSEAADVGGDDAVSSRTASREPSPVKTTEPASNAQVAKDKGDRFDPSGLPESDDAAEILKQVEFYLGDTNLRSDKFMRQEMKKDGGWVKIQVIADFKRMRRFQPFSAVVEALRTSPTLLEVNEEGTEVRRKIPVPDFAKASDALLRTVYFQGFGKETKTLQIELEAFFSSMGQINQTRLQRRSGFEFTGAVAVEFANKEDKDKVVSSTDQLEWGTLPLNIISKKEYYALTPRLPPRADETKKGGPQNGKTKKGDPKKRGPHDRSDDPNPLQKKQKTTANVEGIE